MRLHIVAALVAYGVISLPADGRSQTLSAEGEMPGTRIEVRSLTRDEGGTVTLRFQIVNESDKTISAGSFQESDFDARAVSGVHLIDAGGKKKHLVVRDSKGKCVCSHLSKAIEKGGRVNVWAKFAAPPDNVQRVTVIVPQFEPIEGVPIAQR